MAHFVVVVDTQFDFMHEDGALAVPGAQALVGPMQAWLASLEPGDTAGILFTFDTHDVDRYAGSPEAAEFPVHCVRGTSGWKNMLDWGAVNPSIPIWRLEKSVFAMWEETGLLIQDVRHYEHPTLERETFFAELKQQGIHHVRVIGVAADYCVRWAIEGLIARGFTVDVPKGLTRGIARQIDEVIAADFADANIVVERA